MQHECMFCGELTDCHVERCLLDENETDASCKDTQACLLRRADQYDVPQAEEVQQLHDSDSTERTWFDTVFNR